MLIFSWYIYQIQYNGVRTTVVYAIMLAHQFTSVKVKLTQWTQFAIYIIRNIAVLIFSGKTNNAWRCGTGILMPFFALLAAGEHGMLSVVISIVF